MSLEIFLTILITASAGIVLGYYLRFIVSLGKKKSIELEIKQAQLKADERAKKTILEAEEKATEIIREVRQETKSKEEKLKSIEDRLIKREDYLDKKQADLDSEIESLKIKISEIKDTKVRADNLLTERQKMLEKISGMNESEAKESVIKNIEEKYKEDLLIRIQKLENFNKEKLEERAKDIITTSIQRLGTSVSSDIFSTVVDLPAEEIKGKIIGKEGRNIKSFEKATGVEILVDDTPNAITLSSFDPIRRQIARMALEELIKDGRIQPAKIEKVVEKTKENVDKIIKEKGEKAVFETGVLNLDPRIVSILGRLHFRTSYGQNVLQHSIEMAHIAGMIAEEIGANVQIAKAGALVHDIGKALDHEVQGTHVDIGIRILQKFGANEAIVKAMKSHHDEYPHETVESVIVQIADSISGSRPGARRDSVENYLKRLKDLETIATGFEGVEKAYALEAGREIRIFVKPEQVNDITAKNIARGIVEKIEKELKYPGEIKVNVIRESRVIEFAR